VSPGKNAGALFLFSRQPFPPNKNDFVTARQEQTYFLDELWPDSIVQDAIERGVHLCDWP
jgi:hypothetical protein